jgi:phosphatidyl-myo-inositol dimannoside synthase
MRIALVSQDFPPALGGIQTFSLRTAEELARNGELVYVVAPTHAGDRETDARLPFPVVRVPIRPDLLVIGLIPRLRNLYARERIDVALHAQWPTALTSLLARRLTGYPKRVAIALHGRELAFNPLPRPLAPGYDRLRRRALQGADLLLPNSRFTADLARGLSPALHPTDPIGMGVDVDHFVPVDRQEARGALGIGEGPVLLTVCRLVPRKGVDAVIGAVAELARTYPGVQYVVAGDGPDRERLVAQAARLGVAEHVRFLGRVPHDDLPLLYGACDVSVMTPREDPVDVEGFGIVYLEAGACERPVVGTRAGGIPDAVADGESGLLVPPGDAAALTSALERLLSDYALARRLGQQGRERVLTRFRWAHVAGRIRDAMNHVAPA